ncbi:MAG: hypothetical protein V4735_01805 [Pseudomonadota bacterium]
MANPNTMHAAKPTRAGNGWLTGITLAATLAAGLVLGVVPPIAAGVTHVIERVSNHFKAKKELNARADWYRDQIATTLDMDPRKVRGKHLIEAANTNPVLASAVRDVKREEASENKSSAMINTAVAFVPFGGVAKEVGGVAVAATKGAKALAQASYMGKTIVAQTAGGLLASWTTKEHLSAQEVVEGISSQLAAAKEQGVDPRTVVTPQMIFTLRLAQDEFFAKEIADRYKKPFHKMNDAEQTQVMSEFGALANAATTEAYAVANDMLPVQELMARAPNLKSRSAQYALGTQATTFAGREQARRASSGMAAANDSSYAADEVARRAAAAQNVGAASV